IKGSPKNTFVSTGSGVISGSSPFLLDEHANTLKLIATIINKIVLIHICLIRYLFQNDPPTYHTPLSKSLSYSHGVRMLAGCICPNPNGTYTPMPGTMALPVYQRLTSHTRRRGIAHNTCTRPDYRAKES